MDKYFSLLRETYTSWSAHKAPKMGAALAYYTALSLAPLVVLTVGVVGLFVKHDAARKQIVAEFTALVGEQGGAVIDSILAQPAHPAAGAWATGIGFIVVLVGASGVFAELQDSLNTIWDAPAQDRPWTAMIRERLLSVAMVFALGFLVLVSLLLSAVIAAVGTFSKHLAPGLDVVWEMANSGVTLLIVTLMFAAIFRYLPDVRIAWRDVWIGAGLTGLLFVLGKYLLGLYIGRGAFASAYGAAGSLVIVLFWVFYSAQIFFFGAEFTRAFARMQGSHQGEPPGPAVAAAAANRRG